MKCRKNAILGSALALAVVFLLVSAASAQSLDGKWFKVNCQCTTKAVNTVTGSYSDYNLSFNVYYHFTYFGPGPAPRGSFYGVEVWSQVAPDVWEITTPSAPRATSPYNENFFPDCGVLLAAKNGTEIFTFNTPHVSVNLNCFRGGGEIFMGTNAQGRQLYGWITLKGSLVSALPFKPVEPPLD